MKLFSLCGLLVLLPEAVCAQAGRTSARTAVAPPPPPVTRVELLPGTERLEGGRFNGEEIRKLIGNVRFKQGDILLSCDSAYQYAPPSNRIEAFSNVRLVQADTVTITGQRLTYDGDRRTARMTSPPPVPVTMTDPRMTLTTDALDYDVNRKVASYATGGHLQDPENQLDSRRGAYDTQAKTFRFSKAVKLRNKDYDIATDTLLYNTLSKIATFLGPTTLRGQKGDLYAENGTYNTRTRQSDFKRNARVETPSYRLGGDRLKFDEKTGIGVAVGHVTLVSKQDSVIIRGDYGRANRPLGRSFVSGAPVLESISRGDTMLIGADTLVATDARRTPQGDSVPRMIFAYRKVRIWNKQLQGTCDSLTYNLRDSVIFLNRRPLLWASKSQLKADSMRLYLKKRRLDRLVLRTNSFIVSQDTLRDFNQVKGRHMVAYFRANRLHNVTVDGNGESLYYALDGDSAVTGMNKVVCANMRLAFGDDRQLASISFLTKPDASFIPPQELKPADERLSGFEWHPSEQPTRRSMFGRRTVWVPTAKPKPAKTTGKKART